MSILSSVATPPPPIGTPGVDSQDQMTTFCYLMVEEFLLKKKMMKTLISFRDEWTTKPDDVTSNLSWFNMSLKLHLPDLLKREQEKCSPVANKSIVEHLTMTLIQSSATRMRVEPEVLITGLAELPRHKSTVLLPLPPLIINSPTGSKSAPGSLSLSISSPIGHDHDSDNFKLLKNEIKSEQTLLRKHQKQAHSLIKKYSSSTHSPIRQPPPSSTHQHQHHERKNLHPNLLLKPSTENWIPEIIRFRSIHRELTTLETNLHSTIIMETELNRELRNLNTSATHEIEKIHFEEELGVSKRVACGCCLQLYSRINLPMMIPIKAIIDIRKQWSGGVRGWWSVEDERIEKMGGGSRSYEGIKICTFCSQFFHSQESYRPSFDQMKREEKIKQRNEMKRLEKEYWDPLKMMEQDRERERKMELSSSTGGGNSFDSQEIKGLTSISYE
jgi:hypothetical protein